ncbi:MAG TPA: tail fiber protein [Verrucomicrobiae bacterium]|jgi:microcystin-dependent protein|nr:tail fiber protein [Verrucomicrobiae bacterium]
MDAFTGEIRIFGFSYAPADWASCDGSTIPISQNQVLYSILGNIYGGTYPNTFAVPNLKGVAPMGAGIGPGLTPRQTGDEVGAETVALSSSQMCAHNHTVTLETVPGQQVGANTMSPGPTATSFLSHLYHLTPLPKGPLASFSSSSPTTTLAEPTIGISGQGQGHPNQQPYLVMNFCICTNGEYPVKP